VRSERLLRDVESVLVIRVWLGTVASLLVVLALTGVVLRTLQALGGGAVTDSFFYELLSLHGSGMIGVGLGTGVALLWFVLRHEMPFSIRVMRLYYGMSLTGIVVIVVAVFGGGYDSAWTFLYPLPGQPGGAAAWGPWAGFAFLVGLALIVLGFAAWCLDYLRAAIGRFGTLGQVLGFDVLRSGHPEPGSTNPTVLAGVVVVITGLTACVVGAAIVVMMLVNLADPSFTINPLLAKNMIYFTGHTLANIQIYLGAGLLYSVLPANARRPWYAGRPVVIAWLVTLVVVMLAFFHHLYEDFAQPEAVQVIGNVASYVAALPPLTVTIFGGVLLVYRSGIRWTAAPIFMYAGMAGWAIGGWGAVLDSTPAVNQLFHNTLWVPAHFHTYMAVGEMFFFIGAVFHLVPEFAGRALDETTGRWAALLMAVGGYGLTSAWYASGALGEPRRYSLALPAYDWLAWLGVGFAAVAVLGALLVFFDLVRSFDTGGGEVTVWLDEKTSSATEP
jgi:cytochrome c oxidase subunit I